MAQPTPTPRANTAAREQIVDERVDETFPASDAPQLTDPDHEPHAAPERPPRGTQGGMARGTPATIGNQGAIPQSRMIEETVPLADLGVVTLRFDGDFRHLHVYLGEE